MGFPIKPENDDLSRNIRRFEVRLRVTGTGVLLFAFWSIVKSVLVAVLRNEEDSGESIEAISELNDTELLILFVAAMVVFSFILIADTLMRIAIYRMAKRESSDPNAKRRNSYLVMAGLLIMFSIIAILSVAWSTLNSEYGMSDGVITIVVELSAMITLIELIRSVIILRKYRDEKKALMEAPPDDEAAVEQPSGKEAADE